MAAVAPSASDKTADLLQKLSLESKSKSLEVHDSTKKFGSFGSGNLANGLGKPFERTQAPIQDFSNLSTYYAPHGYPSAPYYYGGYDGPLWNDYRYLNHNLADMYQGSRQRNLSSGYPGRINPSEQIQGHFTNTYRGSSGFGLGYYTSKPNWHGWPTVDSKYSTRGHGNGVFSYSNDNNRDRLNELSKGPRSTGFKNPVDLASLKMVLKGQDAAPEKVKNNAVNVHVPERDQYNKEDFPVNYPDAKFFVIKSYSEDDVHKSIKHNVWASTPNGNKKLDAAYEEAQGKPGGCPIFLLFSVNASGQFVGLAEMVGRVDFDRTLDFWQQDKWTGCIPIKWHIVKDVPNSLLKHIKLENNEDKPVTNSRDTQEVKLEHGLEVLKIFKLHQSKTTILDDFDFYEARERSMQEKKVKRQQFQKHLKDDHTSGDQKLSKTTDVVDRVKASHQIETGETPNSVH
ncbi:hypothetical protein Dimus_001790 [Dionaea muscipula]